MLMNSKQTATETVESAPQRPTEKPQLNGDGRQMKKILYSYFTFYPLGLISPDCLNMLRSELDHSCKSVWHQQVKQRGGTWSRAEELFPQIFHKAWRGKMSSWNVKWTNSWQQVSNKEERKRTWLQTFGHVPAAEGYHPKAPAHAAVSGFSTYLHFPLLKPLDCDKLVLK